jgi:hypothetical protein
VRQKNLACPERQNDTLHSKDRPGIAISPEEDAAMAYRTLAFLFLLLLSAQARGADHQVLMGGFTGRCQNL